MARYDWWADEPRRYADDWYRGGPNRPGGQRPFPWRPPHWWGDPFDPRYAGFELPSRYDRDRNHPWPEPQPSRYSNYGRRLNDDELRSLVRRRLFEDTSLPADRIRVEVRDGIVTLSGEVDDYLEARYAWDDAWETEGVEGVVSRLTVRGESAESEQAGERGEES
jgi:hypothetical protein